jgi:branched-chain amino acid transport system permease protein
VAMEKRKSSMFRSFLARVWKFAAIAVVLLIIPRFLGIYTIYIYSWLLVYLIAVYGLNLILGYAGQISLAQAAFMGIGAYVMAILVTRGVSFWIALPAGALLSFAVGLILGFPALKVKHHYLAMVTIGFNFIMYKLFENQEAITGGYYGIFDITRPSIGSHLFESDLAYARVIAVVALIMIIIMYWILNTRWGRAFKMIRENEVRAEIVGVDIRAYKLIVFAIGSAYAGVAGGLLAPLLGYIEPTLFELTISFDFLLMVLIGGRGRFEGPLIGVAVVILLPEFLRITDQANLLIFSVIAVIVLLLAPEGGASLWDWIFKRVTGRKSPSLTK